jgi:hypothetical protein
MMMSGVQRLTASAALVGLLSYGSAPERVFGNDARNVAPATASAAIPADGQPVSQCQALEGRTIGGALILKATYIATQTVLVSQFGGNADIGSPMCRIQGQVRPTADSDIRFEVWLPDRARWNGYYQAVGGGGNSGNVYLKSMQRAFDGGYAVSGQDNGHVGNSADSSYAIGHPEKVVDFGWRSLHVVAIATKAVINGYYGKPQDLALFNGCSTGGRQALALAQRFPDDYDGISAGAPANDWPALNALGAKFGRYLVDHPEAWVSAEKLQMVQDAVFKHCGAIDGIIDDPQACRLDISTLRCADRVGASCLTDGEIEGLAARYADLADENGKLIYPGYIQGNETSLGRTWFGKTRETRWYSSIAAPMPEGFFRDYVIGRPEWTIRQFDWGRGLPAAQAGVIGKAVAAESPDLTAFAHRGGKLIQWHGWDDMSIPARNSVRYYTAVVKTMGKAKADTFDRLFMGTGVDHCGGGPGPNSIGGGGYSAPNADANHDVMAALIQWIKFHKAPEQIIASRYAPDGSVEAQRPWCAYPNVARWDGKGDRKLATSYRCPIGG